MSSNGICLYCGDCCSKPYVDIPLTTEEMKRIRSLGFEPREKRGLALMPTGHSGCEAYDRLTGECNVYKQRPKFCDMYPFKIVAVEEGPIMYGTNYTTLALILVKCNLGKRIQTPDSLLEELQEDLLETLKWHAIQFNRIGRRLLEERVKTGEVEILGEVK